VKKSAGILAYRRGERGLEVFLVHPGGPFWKNKDEHAWSIPKGEFDDEDPLDAARREFAEETGQSIDGEFVALEPVRSAGKIIHAFAVAADSPDPGRLDSNTFEMAWPPRSGRRQSFPEVDRAAWVPLEEAAGKLHKNQQALVDRLAQLLRRACL
jgi:predicted NUDIX family NTP pyrophosphohydrolase